MNDTELLPAWKHVWRNGIAPLLSLEDLQLLRDALNRDDPRLVQGNTVLPDLEPDRCFDDSFCLGGCALGYIGWQGHELDTCGEVEEFFAGLASECDERLGKPTGIRHFLNWFDAEPRSVVLRELLPEVEHAISRKLLDELAPDPVHGGDLCP